MIRNAEEFVYLRESAIEEDYLRAARDHASLEVWLDVINRFPDMRKWVALNKTVPVEILELLARASESEVRMFVAMKNSLPRDLMVTLANDPADCVRVRIAYNKKVPIDVLLQLTVDPSNDVSSAAVERFKDRA